MNLINWTETEICGVKEIDDQHVKIVEIANELYNNLGTSKRWKLESLMNELVVITKQHFITEEKLMTDHKFINYYSHKLEHDSFLNKVLSFKDKFDRKEVDVNLKFLQTLKTWMENHLELNDKKCCVFLNENGVF